jgi:acyl carrier protein
MDKRLLFVLNSVLNNAGLDTINTLEPAATLRDDLELDSISIAELIASIDVEFDVDINEGEMVQTIGDIMDKLSSNKMK